MNKHRNLKGTLRLYAPALVVLLGGAIKLLTIPNPTAATAVDGLIFILLGVALFIHIGELARRRGKATFRVALGSLWAAARGRRRQPEQTDSAPQTEEECDDR